MLKRLSPCLLVLLLGSSPVLTGCTPTHSAAEEGSGGAASRPAEAAPEAPPPRPDEGVSTKEEHPFWTVVGGVLGLGAAIMVGLLMAGGF